MFTGIIEEVATIEGVRPGGLTVAASTVMGGLRPGGSINVNGACLTVTSRSDSSFGVDIVPETVRRTNLGSLGVGHRVNVERPLPAGGRLDGHMVQGHVDGTGSIRTIVEDGEALLVKVQAPTGIMRYVVEKGFIAVDGASLTVVHCDEDSFKVTIIPHTRDNTLFGSSEVGDVVNLEVDIVAKYVERLTSQARASS